MNELFEQLEEAKQAVKDTQVELMAKMRKKEIDEDMREYYLGKIVAYAEVQGLISTIKGD